MPIYRAWGSGAIPGQINTQSLKIKIIEEKVLPLFWHLQMVRFRVFLDKHVRPQAVGDISVLTCVCLSC